MAQVIGVRVEKLVDFAGAGGLSAILLLATLALVLVGAFVARPLQRRLGVG